ncbi:Sulfate transporter 3,5 isoform 1 [Hibiscus syriacus]|uniref:Sulfate transporter 3,5 isoform 1 n=1 Tax=Hibiscus syriacus TaxID=106335 RepID=A0A6A3BS89_HIBSY|nr:Sulfate transporter 3,5 isoform 1 [Hibiscus syriacus]
MDGIEPCSFNRHPQYPRSTRTRHVYSYGPDEELDDDEEKEQDTDYDNDPDVNYRRVKDGEHFERYPKRQKLRTSVPSFHSRPDHRDSLKREYDWTQQEIYVLLEVWGNRFLQLGRRSLRGADWADVAEKVSDALKSVKNEAQCKRIIDGLKRKFKKEKTKAERMGLNSSKWAFFRKMEMLMGLGSSSSNGFDEMRDSPAESEMDEEDGEEADGESRMKAEVHDEHSMRMLANSVLRFGKIYDKIESSKREHMKELEKMKMDFQKDLEVQKKQILERAQAEISKLKEEDDDDYYDEETEDEDANNENSAENISE